MYKGDMALLRWCGYLPLTEYSEHPFRLVLRTLEDKDVTNC